MKKAVFAALAVCICFGQVTMPASSPEACREGQVTRTSAESLAAQPEAAPTETATILITSPAGGAEIELDGVFAGNAPAALHVATGLHELVVKKGTSVWRRRLQVNAGSVISIYATPAGRDASTREPSGAGGV